MSRVYDDRVCALSEGPLWHPIRQQFFWFDIVGKRLLTRTDVGPQEWRFSLIDGSCELVVSLEAGNPVIRSNDGRADPWGGFWIGTMAGLWARLWFTLIYVTKA
jgi:sugar lactone lactonase YvrE